MFRITPTDRCEGMTQSIFFATFHVDWYTIRDHGVGWLENLAGFNFKYGCVLKRSINDFWEMLGSFSSAMPDSAETSLQLLQFLREQCAYFGWRGYHRRISYMCLVGEAPSLRMNSHQWADVQFPGLVLHRVSGWFPTTLGCYAWWYLHVAWMTPTLYSSTGMKPGDAGPFQRPGLEAGDPQAGPVIRIIFRVPSRDDNAILWTHRDVNQETHI